MVNNNDQRDDALELDGVVPELAVNQELPEGVQESAGELDREYVENERERAEWERKHEIFRHLDPDLLGRRQTLIEEIEERIAAEIGFEDAYEEIQDIERQLAEQSKARGDGE